MNPELKAYVDSWVEKGNSDLSTAQRLIEIEPVILDNACFHCQQAIEKYLKALLSYHLRRVNRTHNINFLLSECAEHEPAFKDLDVGNINVFAVEVRYPGNTVMPELSEAQGYYQLALHIKELVLQKITG